MSQNVSELLGASMAKVREMVDANTGGGAGCGVKIVPVAFLVLQGERVRMLPITEPATSTADRLIEQIPELVDRINEMISQYRAEKKVDVDLA